jgi:hypothetical protein
LRQNGRSFYSPPVFVVIINPDQGIVEQGILKTTALLNWKKASRKRKLFYQPGVTRSQTAG